MQINLKTSIASSKRKRFLDILQFRRKKGKRDGNFRLFCCWDRISKKLDNFRIPKGLIICSHAWTLSKNSKRSKVMFIDWILCFPF